MLTDESFGVAEASVFRTVQGEGNLLGIPMVFVRLSGCSVGCSNCDTNYKPFKNQSKSSLIQEVCSHLSGIDWIWTLDRLFWLCNCLGRLRLLPLE